MTISDLTTKLSARLGYTLDTNSKPTETEAQSFIHEGASKIVGFMPVSFLDSLATSFNVTLVASGDLVEGDMPSDYNRFVGMHDLTTSSDIDLLPITKKAQINSGYDGILLPDYACVRNGSTFIFKGVGIADNVWLTYIPEYDTADLATLDERFEAGILAYATYLSKMQDEEIQDAQLYYSEYQRELEFIVGGKESGSNE